MSQSVVVVGPNLPSSLAAKGSFHVHAEGCADLMRGTIRPYAQGESPVTYSSITEMCDDIYPPEDFECESGEFTGEFHIAPCVHLPLVAERPLTMREIEAADALIDFVNRA